MNRPTATGAEETLLSHANRLREILDADAAFLYLSDIEEAATCELAAQSHGAFEIVPASRKICLRDDLEAIWRGGVPFVAGAEAFSYLPSLETDHWTVLRVGFELIPFGLLLAVRRLRDPNSETEIKNARKPKSRTQVNGSNKISIHFTRRGLAGWCCADLQNFSLLWT